MKKVLITGATGFVGKVFFDRLLREQTFKPVIAVRKQIEAYQNIEQFIAEELAVPIDWTSALTDTEIVVHIAGRAHVLKETASDPLQAFRKINVEATLQLAKQALEAGVKRFIFISSIGVNGNHNSQPFTEDDAPNPENAYALSKLEAEKVLQTLTKGTAMELVIIRPPLVYGEGVKANFQSLLKWVSRSVPLPLGLVNNKRSFVAVDNLVDLMLLCMQHPQAANQLFLVADGEDISTPELLKRAALAMNKSISLLPIPVCLLKTMATAIGKKNMARQLCDSLQVDISKAKTVLGWEPPVTLEIALNKTATSFLKGNGSC